MTITTTPTTAGIHRHQDEFDAVVVGARCAGATLATRLSRAGWRVAVVDRSAFPSDTVSTHVIFPDGLALLDEIGALARLAERHHISPVRYAWRVLGHEVAGTFTPVGGHDRCLSVRRVSLDAVLVELAREAGATMLLGRRVTALLGAGTPQAPVHGVVLDDGRTLRAPWVLAADGQRSTVAHRLGLPRTQERSGEVAMLLGYWRGLPASDWCRLDMHEHHALMSTPCEDGLHLLTVAGGVELTRGTRAQMETRYHEVLRAFPAVLNPRLLDRAELVSPVIGAPETMMRGYFRDATGPGWALVGDSGHFKHPTTGQGIGDALAQARYVAEDLVAGGDLAGYERWRHERSAEPYAFSFRVARLPGPDSGARYAGLAADPVASQTFLDTFTRRARLTEVFTPERSRRWRTAAAYEDGLRRVLTLAESLDDAQLATAVPACPLWSVRDLVAHLAGVAEDSLRGRFFARALDAWEAPHVAAQREDWTAGHVKSRREADPARLLADLEQHGQSYVLALRRGDTAVTDAADWMLSAPLADLAAHLEDLHEALGLTPVPDAPVTRAGFASYRAWLGTRVEARGLAPVRLSDGESEWLLGGDATPAVTLLAPRHELFRVISGRRGLDRLRSLRWEGDPTPYLEVLSPYPLPA